MPLTPCCSRVNCNLLQPAQLVGDKCLFKKHGSQVPRVAPVLGWWLVPHHPLSPMQVEFCKSFGDPTKPRAWSRHAQKISQSKNPSKDKDSVPTEPKKVRRSLPSACPHVSKAVTPGGGGRALGAGTTRDSPVRWFLKADPPQTVFCPLAPFLWDPHRLCFLFAG